MYPTEGFGVRDTDQNLRLLTGGMCWGFFSLFYMEVGPGGT